MTHDRLMTEIANVLHDSVGTMSLNDVAERVIAKLQALGMLRLLDRPIDPAVKEYPADHPAPGDLGSVPL